MSDDRQYESDHVARRVTTEGWACTKCDRFYGNAEHAEHLARWCCSTSMPCDCGRRIQKPYTLCDHCIELKDLERWDAAKKSPWDGKTPLCVWRGDHYLWTEVDVETYLDDLPEGDEPRLEICKPVGPPYFDLSDFLVDCMPEDECEVPGAEEIEKVVNDHIKSITPLAWTGSGVGVDPASLADLMPAPAAGGEA